MQYRTGGAYSTSMDMTVHVHRRGLIDANGTGLLRVVKGNDAKP